MSVFIDTNVLIYAMTSTPYAGSCRRLLSAVAVGDIDATTSVTVVEQAWHVERRSPLGIPPGSMMTLLGFFDRVLACDIDIVEDAMRLTSLPDRLGSADRIVIATCRHHGIDTLISADIAFDDVGWLHRIDPDEAGIDALLGQ